MSNNCELLGFFQNAIITIVKYVTCIYIYRTNAIIKNAMCVEMLERNYLATQLKKNGPTVLVLPKPVSFPYCRVDSYHHCHCLCPLRVLSAVAPFPAAPGPSAALRSQAPQRGPTRSREVLQRGRAAWQQAEYGADTAGE